MKSGCFSRATARARFSRAAGTYEAEAGVQRAAVENLMGALPGMPVPGRILDAGCGTGLLARRLSAYWPASVVTGVDFSEAMIGVARIRPGGDRVRWVAADLLDWNPEEPFDLVASSSALHWIQPLSRLVPRMRGWLSPGGRVVASVMVQGTLAELHALRAEVAPHKPPMERLHSAGEWVCAMERSGFRAVTMDVSRMKVHAPCARDLLTRLRAQGLTSGGLSRARVSLNRSEIERLVLAYDARHGVPGRGVECSYTVALLTAEADPGVEPLAVRR